MRPTEDLILDRVAAYQAVKRMLERINDPFTLLVFYTKTCTKIPLSYIAKQAGVGKPTISMRLAQCLAVLREEME